MLVEIYGVMLFHYVSDKGYLKSLSFVRYQVIGLEALFIHTGSELYFWQYYLELTVYTWHI